MCLKLPWKLLLISTLAVLFSSYSAKGYESFPTNARSPDISTNYDAWCNSIGRKCTLQIHASSVVIDNFIEVLAQDIVSVTPSIYTNYCPLLAFGCISRVFSINLSYRGPRGLIQSQRILFANESVAHSFFSSLKSAIPR